MIVPWTERRFLSGLLEVYDRFTDIRQHNKYLLEYLDYMFRPVNRSSSGHQYSESEVLFRYWDPNT